MEANAFSGPGTGYNVGLYVNNSGTADNLIYSNTFNNLYAASVYQDINRNRNVGGLTVKCNDYSNNISDIDIVSDNIYVTPDFGIAEHQGYLPPTPNPDPTLPAGNTFSDFTAHQWDIFNELNGIVYVYHNPGSTLKKVQPAGDEISGNVSTAEDYDASYTKSGACPPKLTGGGEQLKVNYYSATASADSTRTIIAQITDGGNTQQLGNEVDMAVPGEGLETRNTLLSQSPDLSDTVMVKAIEKENVLPNAMVRDVLVQNPQAAKSVRVQQSLDARSYPMPGYMRQQIDAGRDSLSEKEFSEAALTRFNRKANGLFNRLHRFYTADTNASFGPDSLARLYIANGDLRNRYRLSMLYMTVGDSAACDSVLNNLPYTFSLSTEQETERQAYLSYVHLLENQGDNPDSTAVAALGQIAQNQTGMPSVYVRNLLVWNNQTMYNEPVLLPDTSLKSTPARRQNDGTGKNRETDNYLPVKPNPATGYFIAGWDLHEESESTTIVLTDINGRAVYKTAVYNQKNEKVINTGNLAPGTYVVNILVNGKIIETKKLNLLK